MRHASHEQAKWDLIMAVRGVEVVRMPLPMGRHQVGGSGLRLGGYEGVLCVSRHGVSLRDGGGDERPLSAEPMEMGGVVVAVSSREDDGSLTATHETPRLDDGTEVVSIRTLRDDVETGTWRAADVQMGTDEACDVRLFSSHVSRVHCVLQRRDGHLYIRDAGSKNGTFLNGVRVHESELVLPAYVRVGDVELMLTSEHAPLAGNGIAPYIVGRSEPVMEMLELIARFSPRDAPALVAGENGSGKELVARALHEHSARRNKPFIVVNCGALVPNLAESELFGHVRGAFTGASEKRAGAFMAANGGTLFLDEIGELPLHVQPLLLRVLETRDVRAVGDDKSMTVDVRVIAATHRHLPTAVREGRFREDLFHRLSVLTLSVPPLRERGRDILFLAQHFLTILAPGRALSLSREAMAALLSHRFSGNIRELKNAIHRAICVCDGEVLFPHHLQLDGSLDPEPASRHAKSPSADPVNLEAMERSAFVDALRHARGSRAQAARRLGVARSTVYRKMSALGISDSDIA
jgi:two-component system, NtrC family, response regulator HydG